MPKSKRDKKVSLTKTERKGLSNKQQIIEEIQACRNKYANIFLFSVQNMRNSKLKDLRTEWKNSRFFFGKNRIMQLGLKFVSDDGSDVKLEKDMEQLRDQMFGQCGLLFTSESKKTVLGWFKSYAADEYARSGFRATKSVTLPEGPLKDFSHAIEPHLRALGMPTKLDRGVVTLYKEYTVCEKGKLLTPEQARILKLLGIAMARFKIIINCCFTKEGGYEELHKREVEVTKKTKQTVKRKAGSKAAGAMEEDDDSDDDEDDDDDDEDDDEQMELDEEDSNDEKEA